MKPHPITECAAYINEKLNFRQKLELLKMISSARAKTQKWSFRKITEIFIIKSFGLNDKDLDGFEYSEKD